MSSSLQDLCNPREYKEGILEVAYNIREGILEVAYNIREGILEVAYQYSDQPLGSKLPILS